MPTTRPERIPVPGIQHARRAGLLMLLGAVAAGVPLPWTALALLPLGMALVESVRGLRQMRGGRAPARVVTWASMGLALTVAMTVLALLPFAFYDTSKNYQDCIAGANTSTAAAQCRTDLYAGLNGVLTGWGVGRP